MKRRTFLEDRHWAYMEEIVAGKQEPIRGQLVALSAKWAVGFEDYEKHFAAPDLADLPVRVWSSPGQKETLLHCYDSGTQALSRLKAEIEQAQSQALSRQCPYCCVGIADEFDHYAPKERFPHLAIHSLNLIPCCGRCNRKKSKAWLDAHSLRQLLHFYVDDIPDAQFLFATLSWTTVGISAVPRATYSLQRPAGYSKAKFELIERHFKRLELLPHLRDHTHSKFTEISRAVRISRPKSQAAVKRLLRRYADDVASASGESHWTVVLTRALADDATFLAKTSP